MNSHFTLYNIETSNNNNILYIFSPCKWRLRNECVFIILAYLSLCILAITNAICGR